MSRVDSAPTTPAIFRRTRQALVFAFMLGGLFGFRHAVLSVVVLLTTRVDWWSGNLARPGNA